MWARVTELMLGVWLVSSPLILRGTEQLEHFAPRDVAAGGAVVIFSLLSFWRAAGWAHLGTFLLALALALAAYFGWERPGPPAAQNEITIALLLMMFAVVPNEASRPPRGWRRHHTEQVR